MPQLEHIEAIETRLWEAADTLRANSNYASNEYFLPVMGLVFLRHAYSRYLAVKDEVEAGLPTRGGRKRALTKQDFSRKSAIFLRPEAQFDHLVALPERFPGAELRDVEGLVKLVDRAEVEANDWSLTPGRYVGVAPEEEDEDFDFGETMRAIHAELEELNDEAAALAATIKKNFEALGI